MTEIISKTYNNKGHKNIETNKGVNNDMLKVLYGSITNEREEFLIDNICIIVDTDTGSIVKYGDRDSSDIIQYYEKMYNKYLEVGLEEAAEALKLISFDRYNGVLSIDEICTIVNYGMNAHSKVFLELFKMTEEDLHNEIKRLHQYGY